jgi:uncharacterized protein with HEPN domain
MCVSLSDATALWDMVQAIEKIRTFTAGMTEMDYLHNELVQSAVERKLEILGEAARRVSALFQSQHPTIDWRNTIGLRNVIAHRYEQERIWSIVQAALPELLTLLLPLLPPVDAVGE